MKNICLASVLLILAFLSTGCATHTKKLSKVREDIVRKSEAQYSELNSIAYSSIADKNYMPRTVAEEQLRLVSSYDWTSGFYPGALWYLYQLTQDENWKERALLYTQKLDTIQYWEGNHDVGFIMECSYGNALKAVPSKLFDAVIVQTAKSLSARFRPNAGIIQSWNASKKWNCPVIIDNMMNLELLFHATRISGDSTYYNIAVSHADTTLRNHFREDNSSFHVLNYDTTTGKVLGKYTHQGYADNSAWARGQAWGLYGFTLCYRETKDTKYLEQALRIADFIKNNPELPDDAVPYWDYNVPKTGETPRDASAAAITASALYELSTYVTKRKSDYLDFANKIMLSLSSPKYFAEAGSNKGFLLKHSVGSLPHKVEVDVPLNYADYYFLEALYRSKNLN
ncbi:glycoside hydrolase family 88 protein [Snuella sedimenti]|uniref:Glycoside hydrolase family 88 protein n=1 Tax=Snuella sedimenti TaxID=2798802 RepID=A0A8J7IGQ5_9FLAO|nr:glycoside hydrolase family 88 protein [Snuella sedimenti]MBJ6367066.1 glycoside hydrolase family 88 protein [Snuella sedimenti]